MEIIERIAKSNRCFYENKEKKITVKGLMLHSVGCGQPSAEVFVEQWNSPTVAVCVHAVIDAIDGKVYQILPWNHRAWHCGGNANGTHIGVEMCEPDCIKYTSGSNFVCSDVQKARMMVERTVGVAAELFAFLCKMYNLNPLEDGVIISHKEGHDRGIASGHADPDHLFRQLGMAYSMKRFREDVKRIMDAGVSCPERHYEEKKCEKTHNSYGENVKAGDVVMLAPDSVYYSGAAIPLWVKTQEWIVSSVNGARAVLGKNVKGNQDIKSPVDVKYLRVTSPATLPPPPGGIPIISPPPGSTKEFKVSEKGVAFIAQCEGCRLEAYKCPADKWTIGYGHTKDVCKGQRLASEEEAMELLRQDLIEYAGYVNTYIRNGVITFPVTQYQFDALTSFCYNCGKGNLETLVAGRNAETVAECILKYNKGGGKVLEGLKNRRKEERKMFLGETL